MDARETLERRIDELCRDNEKLRQENQSIGMAAYEIGYKNGSTHYELEHCPACKNIADLQEALAENERLRQIVRCRDCESYRERFNGCVEFGRMEYEEYAIVEPDGFCAWGKRKEA